MERPTTSKAQSTPCSPAAEIHTVVQPARCSWCGAGAGARGQPHCPAVYTHTQPLSSRPNPHGRGTHSMEDYPCSAETPLRGTATEHRGTHDSRQACATELGTCSTRTHMQHSEASTQRPGPTPHAEVPTLLGVHITTTTHTTHKKSTSRDTHAYTTCLAIYTNRHTHSQRRPQPA